MAKDENSYVTDLWGNEVYQSKGKKGRPPFEWTEENSNKVNMLLAMGWTNERIASCILDPRTGNAISVPTLKRHFRSELKSRYIAADRLRLRQFEQAYSAAEAGNVGAMRLFMQLKDKNDLMMAEDRLGSHPTPEEKPAKQKLGKKELSAQETSAAEARLEADLAKEANASRLN